MDENHFIRLQQLRSKVSPDSTRRCCSKNKRLRNLAEGQKRLADVDFRAISGQANITHFINLSKPDCHVARHPAVAKLQKHEVLLFNEASPHI